METQGLLHASSLLLITSVVAFVSISWESNKRAGLKPTPTSGMACSTQPHGHCRESALPNSGWIKISECLNIGVSWRGRAKKEGERVTQIERKRRWRPVMCLCIVGGALDEDTCSGPGSLQSGYLLHVDPSAFTCSPALLWTALPSPPPHSPPPAFCSSSALLPPPALFALLRLTGWWQGMERKG